MLKMSRWKSGLVIFAVMVLAGCGNSSLSSILSSKGDSTTPGSGTSTKRIFTVKPGPDATSQMQTAMVQLLPGDTLHFECGYFELAGTLLVSHTENVVVEGCDSNKDKTVLSFKTSNTPEGILAVNVRMLTVKNLTVLDTGGNGVEFRAVEYGKIENVRAIWSSGGGRQASDANKITASNYSDNNYSRLHVSCTHPATLNPNAPENQYPGADTSSPDYTVSEKSGRYGIYPVSSDKIWITGSESVGASDAGIYVGQTNTALIENSRSAFNVFGFEIENVRGGEYNNNTSECNTGGFLVYDLDNLRQYGHGTVMKGNKVRKNNTYNFTSGGFVGNVPAGSGMITLAYDSVEIHDNEFTDNNTAGIIHTSYEIFPEGAGRPTENKIDWYTEGLHIYHNTFKNNGNKLPLPTTKDLDPNGDGDPSDAQVSRLLPTLVGLKILAGCLNPLNLAQCATASASNLSSNPAGVGLQAAGFRGAHILWDGLLDSYHGDCAYPAGVEQDPLVPGKPGYNAESKDPGCHYNKYKFDTSKTGAPRITPDWYSCIDDDNTFAGDSIAFANFHGTKGLEPVIAAAVNTADPSKVIASLPATDLQNLAATMDRSPHQCVAKYGKNLPKVEELDMPAIFAGFKPSGDYDAAPSDAEIARLCGAGVGSNQVNYAAYSVNCPTLDQYNLFSKADDPTSAPNGGGVPFSLNTKLFSDYSVKYRVLFLPQGQTAIYKDKNSGAGINGTITFPVGTIIAKTFAFRDKTKNMETIVETRLLIKRRNSKGTINYWDGLPYIWTTENGKRVAKLAMGGGTASVSWDYLDADSNAPLKGTATAYNIPNAGQCLSCHSNEDKDPGTAPIGPKVRNLNGPYHSESDKVTDQSLHAVAGKNQLDYWCNTAKILSGCPALTLSTDGKIATNLERLPVFNKVGDGNATDSKKDVEARARAYLEVNCEHCHNDRGYASSTGLFLDSFRAVNQQYGVCKTTTATGAEGRGGHTYDIVPGSGADSIIVFRTGPDAQTPSARMPPIARTVSHKEGNDLLNDWISNVVNKTYANGACGTK